MLETKSFRTFRLTPSRVDSLQRCPRSAVLSPPFTPTPASERGQRIHTVVEMWADSVLAGRTVADASLIERAGIVPGSDEARAASAAVEWVRDWLESTGASLFASECYVRTPPRPMLGRAGIAIELSGRLDLVARAGDTLLLADVKTSALVPAAEHWRAQPSTTIYTLLARHQWRDPARVAVVYLYPQARRVVDARLDEGQVERGRAAIRRIVALLAEDGAAQVATPGQHCAWCAAQTGCPAYVAGDQDVEAF